jgi:hypothetical protein
MYNVLGYMVTIFINFLFLFTVFSKQFFVKIHSKNSRNCVTGVLIG